MREIKFRAWDKNKKVMRFDAQNQYDYLGGGWATSFGEVLTDTDYTVMQYTGLKDKNGKEIYEGDIVKPVQTKGMRWKLATVEYQRGEFVTLPKGETRSFKTLTETGWLKIEIIGNIYENPELLQHD